MKKKINNVTKILVLILMIFSLSGCTKYLKVKEIKNLEMIQNNQDKIKDITIVQQTLLGKFCYKPNLKDTIKQFTKIEKVSKSNIRVTDNYISYIFDIENIGTITLSFEDIYLIDNKQSYLLKDFKHQFNNLEKVECN